MPLHLQLIGPDGAVLDELRAVTGGVLVIGYGNPLRTDDGVGWHAAERLAADPRLDGVTVIGPAPADARARTRRQPRGPRRVRRRQPGTLRRATFTVEPMDRDRQARDGLVAPPRSAESSSTWPESCTVGCPTPFVVSVGVESVLLGDRMSPTVEASLPGVVDAVAELIADHGARPGTVSGAGHRHA